MSVSCQRLRRPARAAFAAAALGAVLAAASASAQRDTTQPGAITAAAYQRQVGVPGAYIRLDWARPARVPSSYIRGYVVWRQSLFAAPTPIGGTYTDYRSFLDSEATRSVTYYDGRPGGDATGLTTAAAVQGVVAGELYHYQVAAAYENGLQDRDRDGFPDAGAQFMSPLSVPSRWVTAIGPPTITEVNDNPSPSGTPVDMRRFRVRWQQTPGADTYVIWVSTDPSFRRGRLSLGSRSVVPVNQGGPATVSRVVDASRLKVRRGRRFYVSVGARRSGEPKPKPFGAIFSAPVALVRETAPPPPP